MQQFLRDNFAISLPCPQKYKEHFAQFEFSDQVIGSIRKTLMPDNIDKIIFSKCKRKALSRHNQDTLQILFCKIYSNIQTVKVMVNSIYHEYSSVNFKGRVFSVSKKKSIPYIVLAQWNENLFGSPPTLLHDSYIPTENIRPVSVKCYIYNRNSNLLPYLCTCFMATTSSTKVCYWKASRTLA